MRKRGEPSSLPPGTFKGLDSLAIKRLNYNSSLTGFSTVSRLESHPSVSGLESLPSLSGFKLKPSVSGLEILSIMPD